MPGKGSMMVTDAQETPRISVFHCVSLCVKRCAVVILSLAMLTACSGSESDTEAPDHIRILDEIPEHIHEIENLTVFPGDSDPRYSIQLIPQQTFGEEGEPYLTTVQRSAVDDNGRIIILNSNSDYSQSVFVYNDDGTFHTELGRSGRGPGEHGYIFDLQARGGNVYIRDAMNQRINIYSSTDYSFESTMMIEQLPIRDHETVQGLELGLILPRNDGNYLVNFYQRNSDDGWRIHRYMLMDENGNAVDYESTEFRSSFKAQGYTDADIRMVYMSMPFLGGSVSGYSKYGELYKAWNQDFLINKYNAKGEYQSAIYYAIQGSPFELSHHTPTAFYKENDVLKAIGLHNQSLPETNPVISMLMADDENRIWAAVPMYGEPMKYEWWILAPSGELLAKMQRPREKTIFDIKDGYLYAKEIDEETGAEFVVKNRMEWTERS
jgi:hypothetical protein